MNKGIKIFILIVFLFILERLYLLPIYIPLDTKPIGFRSAAYLAKSIAHEANADVSLAWEEFEYTENDRVFTFSANIDDAFFNISIYLDKSMRDRALKNIIEKNEGTSNLPCFKAGKFYIVCETYSVKSKHDKPIFKGEKYYKQFPGEDLVYRIN